MNTSGLLSTPMQGGVTMVALLIGIAIAWYALGAIRWEIFMRDPYTRAARLLRLLFAILIGTGVAGFLIQYATAAALMRS